MQGGDTGEKETNQGGLCRHAKELGHYSVYDREVLKPESAFIKLCVCVCVCVWCVCVQACVCVCVSQKPLKLWNGSSQGALV